MELSEVRRNILAAMYNDRSELKVARQLEMNVAYVTGEITTLTATRGFGMFDVLMLQFVMTHWQLVTPVRTAYAQRVVERLDVTTHRQVRGLVEIMKTPSGAAEYLRLNGGAKVVNQWLRHQAAERGIAYLPSRGPTLLTDFWVGGNLSA